MNELDNFFSNDPKVYARSYLNYLVKILSSINIAEIEAFIKVLLNAREEGRAIFFIGNGGSAATASHFANDISIGTSSYKKPFRAISLADNIAVITAIGNDFGYRDIFSRQLKVLAKPGDVLVAISASGNSENLIKSFEVSKEMGLITIAITAFDGGKLKQIADQGIHIPTGLKEYGPAEDMHMILDHLVGSYLMRFVLSNG